MLQNPDGNVSIRNDGATMLEQIDVNNQIANMMVELAQSQHNKVGDRTIEAKSVLEQAEMLLERGIHPI